GLQSTLRHRTKGKYSFRSIRLEITVIPALSCFAARYPVAPYGAAFLLLDFALLKKCLLLVSTNLSKTHCVNDGSLCQTTIKDSPTYCDSTAAGNWFIVVDASWYSDSDESTSYKKIKHYYQEQKHIAEKMIDYISEINHKEVNSDDKHEICLILATNRKIEVIKKLCEEKTADQKLPFTAEPTTDGILPEEILNEIDEQPTHCNWRPNRQRFV
uniref:Uncharacterized protein n=1 Tax=Romanomermis culicivorax TaxID=13658 RepID=A0A915I3P0_ROMCU